MEQVIVKMNDKTVYFSTRSIFSGIVISYIFLYTGSSFWISSIIGTIIGIVILSLHKNTSNKFSRIISATIISLIAFSLLINMAHSLYLNNTPIWLLTLIGVATLLITSKSKMSSHIKITQIFFTYAFILFLIAVIGLIPHVNMEYMRPLFVNDLKSIIWCSIVFALSSVVPTITLIEDNKKNNTILLYLLSCITIIITCFFAISVLGVKEVKLYRFPEYVVLKRIKFLNFIRNADTFINFAIILDIIITMTKNMMLVEYESNKITKYMIITIIGIITSWACYNNWPMILMYKYFPFVLIFLLIILMMPKKIMYKK